MTSVGLPETPRQLLTFLIVRPRTGYADTEARARTDRMPARLAEAAGVWYDEFSNLAEPIAVSGEPDTLHLPPDAAATRWIDGLQPEGAVVLATYRHPHFGRWPAATTHAHGRGRITHVGTVPNTSFARALLRWAATGRVVILRNQGTSQIAYGEVDLGRSAGAYYQLVNRKTGQVIGTGNKTNDANLGNHDTPDVVLEAVGAPDNKDTQYWHTVTKPDGAVTLLNKSGGRAAAIWTGNATVGQRIGQWVDDTAGGTFNVVKTPDGYTRFQAAKNMNVYLTGASAGDPLTLQNAATDGSQDWQLLEQPAPPTQQPTQGPPPSTPPRSAPTSVPATSAPPTTAPAARTGDGGGGLPLTGSPTALVAGAGALVLAIGALMVVVARRRRVMFDSAN